MDKWLVVNRAFSIVEPHDLEPRLFACGTIRIRPQHVALLLNQFCIALLRMIEGRFIFKLERDGVLEPAEHKGA